MDSNAIALLLKQTIGLDPQSIGLAAIERAVQQRALACRMRDCAAYVAYVQASPRELQELIEEVVVPETWFFRDQAAFTALGQWVHPAALPSRHPLRLLSAPCSTGEEPYSMALTLLEAGLAPEQFNIDALDVSGRALAQAQRGIFGRNSFRGAPLEFRRRYFDAVGTQHRLKSDVPHRVFFEQANLMDADKFSHRGPYDVVFCRNVFIYLKESAQDKLLRLLRRLLAEQGLLFVGPAESARLLDRGFVSAGWPGAFAFRKAETNAPSRKPEPVRWECPLLPPAQPESPLRPGAGDAFAARLQLARQLADQSQLAEAARHCRALLAEDPENTDSLCLLGLVRDAEGDPEAACELYRKALYVDPTNTEALTHLALLNESWGDHASARLLQQRARRVQRKFQA